MSGMPGVPLFSSGLSATTASVVKIQKRTVYISQL
jgi:hypothetical protein